jgi:hypothetical protein
LLVGETAQHRITVAATLEPTMHSACLPPCPAIPPRSRGWRRAVEAVAAALARFAARPAVAAPTADPADPGSWTAAQRAALRQLPARTLRDIGAPEWVRHDASAAGRAGFDLLRF